MPVITPIPTPLRGIPGLDVHARYPGRYWAENFETDPLAVAFDVQVGTTASIDATHAHSGTNAVLIHKTGSANSSIRTIRNTTSVVVGRFWFWTAAAASATYQPIALVAGVNTVFNVPVSGLLTSGFTGTTIGSGTQVADGAWHSCDFRTDYRNAVGVFDWMVDGVAKTQVTAAVTGAAPSQFKLDVSGAVTQDFWVDDVQLSDSWSDYPLADIPSGSVAWTQPIADTVTLADAVTFDIAMTLPGDSVTPTDALAFDRGLEVDDSVTMSDGIVPVHGFTETIADSVTMSDALQFDRAMVIADALSLADAVMFDRALLIADTLALADLASPASGVSVTLADTVALADAFVFDRGLTLTDAASLADAVSFQRGLVLADNPTLADALAFDRALTLAEAVALVDNANPVKNGGGTDWIQPVTDSVTLADALNFARSIHIDDAVALADLISFVLPVILTAPFQSSPTAGVSDSPGVAEFLDEPLVGASSSPTSGQFG